MKQTIELLLHLSFKAERFLQMAFKIFISWFKIYLGVAKLLRGHRAILSYSGLKFSQFQPRKGNILLYPYSKVIGLTNYKLRVSNYQPNVHQFFW